MSKKRTSEKCTERQPQRMARLPSRIYVDG